ncbi:putative aminoacrylate peracid reductase RutC [bioreactor metagenome]|uniref:Putative aminoacrylate peracid reductase RutC n=1 Tax=bioreactor metagenome TaxID=1076179 RepID=A0A644YQC8_9ZZZZ
MKKTVFPAGVVPAAPYSPAVIADGLVFVSGQVGYDMVNKRYFGTDVETQFRGALDNLSSVLQAAGTDLAHVVKTTVFLTDSAQFPTINEIYRAYFPAEQPARSCVIVAGLPLGALIEIEAVAVLPD